ncbi:hypothetical protein CATMQ487_11630 [Sphaerotilus microaerophilus]|uniref:Uncharacterized protein n=1 Tax=Sphaerotilus microaerophilus TaxID=2914710 RepID=A0ABN6PH02_9BURK|nr:hypothetical protein CATMQ487_11630 [Sphaerotilus sp. FB-5]
MGAPGTSIAPARSPNASSTARVPAGKAPTARTGARANHASNHSPEAATAQAWLK